MHPSALQVPVIPFGRTFPARTCQRSCYLENHNHDNKASREYSHVAVGMDKEEKAHYHYYTPYLSIRILTHGTLFKFAYVVWGKERD